jgi:endonuclease/exonuclease/phosphatase family metal-dependent hydrolase
MAAAGCGLGNGNGEPVQLNAAPAARVEARSVEPLRVMSFNIRTSTIFDLFNTWGLRKELLVTTIRDFKPDLLGTQECQHQQARYLRQQLDEYAFVGVGRSDGQTAGEMMGIFYRKSRFEKLDHGHFWLSTRPQHPGSKSWGSLFPRMVTWVRLRPSHGGEPIFFFNTHFSAFNSDARIHSATLLRDRIAKIAGHSPIIVTGDFNADAGARPHQLLLESEAIAGRSLTDTFAALAEEKRSPGTIHGFDGRADGRRIDWILTSRDFDPLSAGIDRRHTGGRYPSDHFPVTATLDWPARLAGSDRDQTETPDDEL